MHLHNLGFKGTLQFSHNMFFLLPISQATRQKPLHWFLLKLTHNKGAEKPPTFERCLVVRCAHDHDLFRTKDSSSINLITKQEEDSRAQPIQIESEVVGQ